MTDIKNQAENLKNFPMDKILKKDSYINVLINENYYQGYIREIKSNSKYEISYLITSNKLENKNNLTSKEIFFFGYNYLSNNYNTRDIFLNQKLNEVLLDNDLNLNILNKLRDIYIDINTINTEVDNLDINSQKYLINNLSELERDNPALKIQDERGNEFNITGYYTSQFFSGFFIDVIVYIKNKLESILKESLKDNNSNILLTDEFKKIINITLNLIIFVLSLSIRHISRIKEIFQINRKIILVDKISSILASLEIILANALLIFCYRFYSQPDIEQKLVIICQLCYDMIINNSNNNYIYLQLFLSLINFITYEDNIIRITNFDKNKVYTSFLNIIQSLTETDIKYIKNLSDIKNSCINIVKKLYKKEINVLVKILIILPLKN